MRKRNYKPTPPKKKETWDLCLYIADRTPPSLTAIRNLNAFCKKWLSGRCRIKIIDVRADPNVARMENIVALPTLERRSPKPVRRVIGALSDMDRVLSGLGVRNCSYIRRI